jgi:hypothetical protein
VGALAVSASAPIDLGDPALGKARRGDLRWRGSSTRRHGPFAHFFDDHVLAAFLPTDAPP